MNERYDFVLKTAHEIIDKYYLSIPRDLEKLCNCLGITLMPLSKWLNGGFTEEQFYRIIRNDDGAASYVDGIGVCILYNDSKPNHRVRFTLAEEIMHIALGHVYDEMFRADRHFDLERYEQYEHEAKLGASILLMPPNLYYRFRDQYKLRKLASIFDMSEAAAYRAVLYYENNEGFVRSHFGTYCPRYDIGRYEPDISYRPRSVWASDAEAIML